MCRTGADAVVCASDTVSLFTQLLNKIPPEILINVLVLVGTANGVCTLHSTSFFIIASDYLGWAWLRRLHFWWRYLADVSTAMS